MFTLPKLPYSYDALQPHIDSKTMEIHYTKHHQGYVDKLNAALKGHNKLTGLTLDQLLADLDSIPSDIRAAVRNNGGGHVNHSLFWTIMSRDGGGKPIGKLAQAIDQDLGGFESFQEQFSNAAATQFGSGWAWLTVENGELHVCSTPNQDNPRMKGNTPILGIDVWEHAYYLNYQNRRPDYISSWWSLVNWKQVEQNYLDATTVS